MEDHQTKRFSESQKAFRLGLDLCGLLTHQIVSPDPEVRKKNIQHTIECIELGLCQGKYNDSSEYQR